MLRNIIYITGNDSYGVEKELSRFIKVFQDKYTDVNIDRYRIDDKNMLPVIRDTLFTVGLFSEKRLFIFSG
jgi:DNA polymerase III delta subunit